MGKKRMVSWAAAAALCLFAIMAAPVTEALAQGPGMPPPQGQRPPGQPGGGAPQGQPGGGGGGANSCMQSYQRCVMMCAGVGNCVNNCNVGYSVCMQQQGGRK